MILRGSAVSDLPSGNLLRSLTTKRVMTLVGFSFVGALIDYSDVIASEGMIVMAAFTLAGVVVSLVLDNRRNTRFPVLMHAVFACRDSTGGEGVVENVSMGGCEVRSTSPATSGAELRLELHPTGDASPIVIESACVRWVAERHFGLQFREMGQEHTARLQHLLNQLS